MYMVRACVCACVRACVRVAIIISKTIQVVLAWEFYTSMNSLFSSASYIHDIIIKHN